MGYSIRITEEIVKKLTWRNEGGDKGDKILVIRDLPLKKMKRIKPKSPMQPIGLLDTLPLEILLCIFEYLDFQSLLRFTQVCLRAKLTVESMPAYAEMRRHAGEALMALGETRLLRYHSAALLRQTLRSPYCVSCFDFGGFLFLPTCERVCFECMHKNRGLHMMTLNMAKKCFDLTDKQLKSIPTLYSIPNTYNVNHFISRKRMVRLVCAKQVKMFALQIHGPQKLAKLIPWVPPRGIERNSAVTKEYWMLRGFHKAPLAPIGRHLSMLPINLDLPDDDYGGMASVRMPYLNNKGHRERGRICRGCRLIVDLYEKDQLPPHVIRSLVPPGVPEFLPLIGHMYRMRSEGGFQHHICWCFGVKKLLTQWGYVPKPAS
ncbi:F-box domain-containing protein [Fusarium sp. LHS14.1]|nr:F-box domain-containing protein [Fusarium sp. LHS14.1]